MSLTPTMEAATSPHVQNILDRLNADELDDHIGSDAAALIASLAAQVAPEYLTVCLNTNTARRGGVSVVLPPNHAVALHALANGYPANVRLNDLHRALWGSRNDRSINTVRVMMTELRKKIAPLKVDILNTHGVGYRLGLNPI